MSVPNLQESRLYAFVDTAYLNGRSPEALGEALCNGGADLIQFRAKDWPLEQIRTTGERLAAICAAHDVPLVINDYLAIAQECRAAYCHLGQEDFFETGRKHVTDWISEKESIGIGLSTHAPEQAERSLQAGAAYVAVGPVYATPTKPSATPVRLDYVRWAAEYIVDLPWFAIGGINVDTVDDVLSAGATRICVVSAILNSSSPRDACREFKDRLASRCP